MKVSLDTEPPTLALGAAVEDGTVTNQRVLPMSGTAADGDGDVVRVEASVDGGAWYVNVSGGCKSYRPKIVYSTFSRCVS